MMTCEVLHLIRVAMGVAYQVIKAGVDLMI